MLCVVEETFLQGLFDSPDDGLRRRDRNVRGLKYLGARIHDCKVKGFFFFAASRCGTAKRQRHLCKPGHKVSTHLLRYLKWRRNDVTTKLQFQTQYHSYYTSLQARKVITLSDPNTANTIP